MSDLNADRPAPYQLDAEYQAERLIATAAAGIRRRQRTAYLDLSREAEIWIDQAEARNNLVLNLAVELERAYNALGAAAQRIVARIADLESDPAFAWDSGAEVEDRSGAVSGDFFDPPELDSTPRIEHPQTIPRVSATGQPEFRDAA